MWPPYGAACHRLWQLWSLLDTNLFVICTVLTRRLKVPGCSCHPAAASGRPCAYSSSSPLRVPMSIMSCSPFNAPVCVFILQSLPCAHVRLHPAIPSECLYGCSVLQALVAKEAAELRTAELEAELARKARLVSRCAWWPVLIYGWDDQAVSKPCAGSEWASCLALGSSGRPRSLERAGWAAQCAQSACARSPTLPCTARLGSASGHAGLSKWHGKGLLSKSARTAVPLVHASQLCTVHAFPPCMAHAAQVGVGRRRARHAGEPAAHLRAEPGRQGLHDHAAAGCGGGCAGRRQPGAHGWCMHSKAAVATTQGGGSQVRGSQVRSAGACSAASPATRSLPFSAVLLGSCPLVGLQLRPPPPPKGVHKGAAGWSPVHLCCAAGSRSLWTSLKSFPTDIVKAAARCNQCLLAPCAPQPWNIRVSPDCHSMSQQT